MSVAKQNLNRILNTLVRAQKFFLGQLDSSSWEGSEAINAFDALEYAIRFARDTENAMPVCAKCGGIFSQAIEEVHRQCQNCDHFWDSTSSMKCHAFEPVVREDEVFPNFYSVIPALQDVETFLQGQEEYNFKKSAEFINHSLQWAVQFSCHHATTDGERTLRVV